MCPTSKMMQNSTPLKLQNLTRPQYHPKIPRNLGLKNLTITKLSLSQLTKLDSSKQSSINLNNVVMQKVCREQGYTVYKHGRRNSPWLGKCVLSMRLYPSSLSIVDIISWAHCSQRTATLCLLTRLKERGKRGKHRIRGEDK